jgi:hypothetical protein
MFKNINVFTKAIQKRCEHSEYEAARSMWHLLNLIQIAA